MSQIFSMISRSFNMNGSMRTVRSEMQRSNRT